MPPQQEPPPVPRGRSPATKPLATRKPQVSPVSVGERPAVSETAAAATCHGQQPGQAAEDAAKLQSQPLEAIFPNGLLPTKEISDLSSSDNADNDEDSSPQPVKSTLESGPSALISQSPVDPPKPLTITNEILPKDPFPRSTEETQPQLARPELKDSILISPPQREPATGFPIPPPEPLQVTPQSYPWLYMSSTLEACFTDSETPAKKENHPEVETPVSKEEMKIAPNEEKARYESEHAIEFRDDELASDTFIKEAPAMMQSFTTFSEVSERVEAEALQLAMHTPSLESEEPLKVYNDMMDNLGELLQHAEDLRSAIQRLTMTMSVSEDEVQPSSPSLAKVDGDLDTNGEQEENRKSGQEAESARTQILGVFQACLPVLSARIANLSMAQELIDSAQENFSLSLRMEEMGID